MAASPLLLCPLINAFQGLATIRTDFPLDYAEIGKSNASLRAHHALPRRNNLDVGTILVRASIQWQSINCRYVI
jgi:hypothetical protein